MQLESTLAQFPLAELIPMIVGSSVTGCLDVGDLATSRMFFRDGKLYHATSGEHHGIPALCQIFAQQDALFRFTAGLTSAESTLWQDVDDLIEFAQHYNTTWERVCRHMPSFEVVPKLCQTEAANVLLDDSMWRTFALIDGERSVAAIAEELGQVPLEVATALCNLIEQGAVRIEQPRARQMPPVLPRASSSFFRRILAAPGD